MFRLGKQHCREDRRSREGAWIEMRGLVNMDYAVNRRSREGAWIEIALQYHAGTSPPSLP